MAVLLLYWNCLLNRRRQAMAVALQDAGRYCLAGSFLLMAIPAQGPHILQRRLQFIQIHVAQLEYFLLLIEHSQVAAAPIGR